MLQTVLEHVLWFAAIFSVFDLFMHVGKGKNNGAQ